jgi:hypothetical protein
VDLIFVCICCIRMCWCLLIPTIVFVAYVRVVVEANIDAGVGLDVGVNFVFYIVSASPVYSDTYLTEHSWTCDICVGRDVVLC